MNQLIQKFNEQKKSKIPWSKGRTFPANNHFFFSGFPTSANPINRVTCIPFPGINSEDF